MRSKCGALLVLALSLALLAGTAACSSADSKKTSQTADNGVATLSPKEVADKAFAYLKTVDRFNIKGTGSSGSESFAMDYSFTKQNSAGSITYQGAEIELRSVDDIVYFRPSEDFWRKQAGAQAQAVLRMLGGKWIKATSADKDFEEITSLVEREKFLASFIEDSKGEPKVGAAKTINGVECLALEDTDGTATLYVAKADARPIQIVSENAKQGGTLDFKYVGIEEPVAPDAKDTIDASTFSK